MPANKWEQLAKGLEIPNKEGIIPPELIERLDLVYSLCNDSGGLYLHRGIDLQHSVQNVGGVFIEVRKILTPEKSSVKVLVTDSRTGPIIGKGTISDYIGDRSEVIRRMSGEDKPFDELFIFGIILRPALGDFAATPIFCLGERPEGEDMDQGYTSYHGLYPVRSSNGFTRINQNVWEGRIDIYPNGEGSVYCGQNSYAEAVLFNELIPFDLEKRLILARSPNGSMNFDALHRLELCEGDKDFEYALIYAKMNSEREGIRKDKTFAVNTTKGLTWE